METIKEIINNMLLGNRGCSPEALKERLAEFEEEFHRGDGYALIRAMGFCAVLNLYIPDWIVDGLCALDEGFASGHFSDLNEAFGWSNGCRSRGERRRAYKDRIAGPLLLERMAAKHFDPKTYHGDGKGSLNTENGYSNYAGELNECGDILSNDYIPLVSKRGGRKNDGDEKLTRNDVGRIYNSPDGDFIRETPKNQAGGHAWCFGKVADGSVEWFIEEIRARRPSDT